MKRVCREQPDWLLPLVDGLLTDVAAIEQASAQWTLANLCEALWPSLDKTQRMLAVKVLKRNLDVWDDWIVLNSTMQALADWATDDKRLRTWLVPRLNRLRDDSRRSVAGRAGKLYRKLCELS